MKKILKLLTAIFFTLIISNQAFAINAPSGLKVTDNQSDYISISWESVPEASGYYIYYGKKPGRDSTYDSYIENIITDNNSTIPNLDSNTTYYISVTALDVEQKESEYSEELVSTTLPNTIEDNNFELVEVTNRKVNEVELTFNNDLDKKMQGAKEIKIVNKNDNLESFNIEKSEIIDNNKLILTLDNNLVEGTEYEVVIIELYDINGKIIKEGVNAINSFIYEHKPEYDETEIVTPPEVITPIEPTIEEPEVNAAVENVPENNNVNEDINNNNEDFNGNIGGEVNSEELASAGVEATELPEAGAKHIILLLLSLFLGLLFILIVSKQKKA